MHKSPCLNIKAIVSSEGLVNLMNQNKAEKIVETRYYDLTVTSVKPLTDTRESGDRLKYLKDVCGVCN